MDLVGHLFGGAAAGKFVATVIGEGGTTGIMETVTQQLGLGLMLSTLLITVPPMAGMWFNGVMGSFSAYSVIGNGNGNRQEVPPHLDGGRSQQINQSAISNKSSSDPNQAVTNHHTFTGWNPPSPPSVDPNMIKPHGSSTLGAAKEPLPSTSNPQPPTEKNEKS